MITAHPLLSYRISQDGTLLSQAYFDDFLLCVLIAREMKECLSKLSGGVLLVEIFYPNSECVPAADLAAAYVALDTLAPGTELGCPIRKNIRQLVESRAAFALLPASKVY
jgi:hypothetical protein